MATTTLPTLTAKDLTTDQEVRWCPGCGDYSILAQMKKALTTVGVPKENMAFVSGIGCSSRFPYYMNTYGFHTIHGRAPTFATGLRLANPDLQVWLVTGDGDYVPLVECLKMHGCRVEVVSFERSTAGELIKAAEEVQYGRQTPDRAAAAYVAASKAAIGQG